MLIARGTRHQQLRTMTVAGLFDRFPGFPEGWTSSLNLDYYQRQTRSTEADFFLAARADPSHAGLVAAVRGGPAGPGAGDRLNIDTTETSLTRTSRA